MNRRRRHCHGMAAWTRNLNRDHHQPNSIMAANATTRPRKARRNRLIGGLGVGSTGPTEDSLWRDTTVAIARSSSLQPLPASSEWGDFWSTPVVQDGDGVTWASQRPGGAMAVAAKRTEPLLPEQ